MNNSEPNPNATPGRVAYARKWLAFPVGHPDRPDYDSSTGKITASLAQKKEAHAEMVHELKVREWTGRVGQYPRTVVGKLWSASDGGFTQVGIEAGQGRGKFTDRMGMSPKAIRLTNLLRGGDATDANFVFSEPAVAYGNTKLLGLAFMQFQAPGNTRSARANSRGRVPITTTYYLPEEEAVSFLGDIVNDPDLAPDVWDRAIAPCMPEWNRNPGVPEQIYRVRASRLAAVPEALLKRAESQSGWKSQQFAFFEGNVNWRDYSHPHGGEMPPASLEPFIATGV